MAQKVSLCMIVKDEVRNLPACLAGISGLVDEMIIVDTGSTDGTKELAASLGAKVSEFSWIGDFAAARNESCRLATGEWILWLDADDRIDKANRARLADLIGRLGAVDPARHMLFMMDCIATRQWGRFVDWVTHTRLFRNTPDLRWKGRVHERLEFAGDSRRLRPVPTDIAIRHEGYDDPAQCVAKNHRNMRILEQEYLADPDDMHVLFNLGRLRHWQGRLSEAIRFLQRSIAQDRRGSSSNTPRAYTFLADCHQKMNREPDALRTTDEGLARFCDYVPLLYQKACVLVSMGRRADAEIILRRIVTIPPRQWAAVGAWPELQGVQARLMLGRICHEQGRHTEAEAQYELALTHQPDSVEAWFHLGQFKLSLNRTVEAEPIVARLSQCPGAEFECNLLRGQICILNERFEDAKKWVHEAIAIQPDNVGGHFVLSGLLFREGRDLQRCLEVHAKVLAMDPSQAEVRARLEQLHAMQSRRIATRPVVEVGAMAAVHPAMTQLSDLGSGSGLAFSC